MRRTFLLLTLAGLIAGCGSSSPTEPVAVAAAVATPTRPAAPTAAPTLIPVEADTSPALLRIRLEYGTEPDQFGWLQLPDRPAPAAGFPVVVLVHGGFWRQPFDVSLMDGLADDLADRGYASWNIEYQRVGGAGGWPTTGDDVAAAINHLGAVGNDQSLNLNQIVSVGHSAGGHLALWALGQTGQVTVRGSVGLGAVVDLAYFRESEALLGGTAEDVPDVYSDAAPVLDPDRVVLIQGSSDSIVPQASLQVAIDRQIPVVLIGGDDHFDLIDPGSDSWAAAIRSIEDFLTD